MTYPPAMQQLGAKWRGVWNTKGFDKAAALASLRVTIKGTKWEHYDDVQLKALAKTLRHRAKRITADQKQKANVKAARDAGRNERGELPPAETRRLARELAERTGDSSAIDAIHAVDKAADDARRNERGELPATETRRLAWEHALRTGDFSAIDAIHAADNDRHHRKIARWKDGAARGDAECVRKLKKYHEAYRAAFGGEVKCNPERWKEIVANVIALSARLATRRLRRTEATKFVRELLSPQRLARRKSGGTAYVMVGLVGVYGADNCDTQDDALQALVGLPYAASTSAHKTSAFRRTVLGFGRELERLDPTSCISIANRCVRACTAAADTTQSLMCSTLLPSLSPSLPPLQLPLDRTRCRAEGPRRCDGRFASLGGLRSAVGRQRALRPSRQAHR